MKAERQVQRPRPRSFSALPHAGSVLSLSASVPSCEQDRDPPWKGCWDQAPTAGSQSHFSAFLSFFFLTKNTWFIKDNLSSAAFIQKTKQMKK